MITRSDKTFRVDVHDRRGDLFDDGREGEASLIAGLRNGLILCGELRGYGKSGQESGQQGWNEKKFSVKHSVYSIKQDFFRSKRL